MQGFRAAESAFLSVCFTCKPLGLYQHAGTPEPGKPAADPQQIPAQLGPQSSNFGFRVNPDTGKALETKAFHVF
jgi:hypothetical protein